MASWEKQLYFLHILHASNFVIKPLPFFTADPLSLCMCRLFVVVRLTIVSTLLKMLMNNFTYYKSNTRNITTIPHRLILLPIIISIEVAR